MCSFLLLLINSVTCLENGQLTVSFRDFKKTLNLEEQSVTFDNFSVVLSPIKKFLSIKPNFSELIVQTDTVDEFCNLTCVPENDLDKYLESFGHETLGILNLESSFLINSIFSRCSPKFA